MCMRSVDGGHFHRTLFRVVPVAIGRIDLQRRNRGRRKNPVKGIQKVERTINLTTKRKAYARCQAVSFLYLRMI
jgi:hypothetical protein